MLHIVEFLKKFAGLAPPEKYVKDAVIQAVLKEVGERLDPGNITIRGSSVFLTASSSLKNEVYMRKNEILAALKEILGEKAPKDIR